MRHFLAIFTVVLWALSASGAAPRWESVDMPAPVLLTTGGERNTDDSGIELAIKDGYIYIGSAQPVTVKIFTILGQLINQESLSAGTHRLRIGTRGVYILKIGTSTRRITI